MCSRPALVTPTNSAPMGRLSHFDITAAINMYNLQMRTTLDRQKIMRRRTPYMGPEDMDMPGWRLVLMEGASRR